MQCFEVETCPVRKAEDKIGEHGKGRDGEEVEACLTQTSRTTQDFPLRASETYGCDQIGAPEHNAGERLRRWRERMSGDVRFCLQTKHACVL